MILAKIQAIFFEATNTLQFSDHEMVKYGIAPPQLVIPKQLYTREKVIFACKGTIEYLHPANSIYSFDNYLTGIQHTADPFFFVSIFKDGSTVKQNKPTPNNVRTACLSLANETSTSKILINHNGTVVFGIRLMKKQG